MPIEASTQFELHIGPSTECSASLHSIRLDKDTRCDLIGPFLKEGLFFQDPEFLLINTNVRLVQDEVFKEGTLSLYEYFLNYFGTVSVTDPEFDSFINLFVRPDTISYTNLYLDYIERLIVSNVNLFDLYRYLEKDNGFSTYPEVTASAYVDFELVDETGPQILNETPTSGSGLNDPLTEIFFELRDNELTEIVPSSIEFYINDTQVIDAGVDVTPPSFGVTTFNEISVSYYQFRFIPEDPFSPDAPVVISGVAMDAILPSGNWSNFLYDFRVWKTYDLIASITGVADVTPPYLDNISPIPYSVDVPIDTSISFDINDLHTGISLDSAIIKLAETVVFSGGDEQNSSYAVTTINSVSGGKGIHFNINPVENLPFGTTVDVDVYMEDLYSSPNILNTSFSFATQVNNHLTSSGFQIYAISGYEDIYIGDSYITTSSTPFRVDFINTSGIAIDTAASYISLNGTSIPVTYSSVNGAYHYRATFDLAPDYTQDANLIFHIQQSGTVYGNVVYRDISHRLLWGYEACYDPDTNFEYDQDVNTTLEVYDYGDYYTISNLVHKFSTTPLFQRQLQASILGVAYPSLGLGASLLSNNTFYEYGKTMYLTLEAEDFAGNKLIYNWSYEIENNS